jgi:hypothetical protein
MSRGSLDTPDGPLAANYETEAMIRWRAFARRVCHTSKRQMGVSREAHLLMLRFSAFYCCAIV